jgi:hypothetical protein
VETAALTLSYYTFLARTVTGLIYVLEQGPKLASTATDPENIENLFGDLRMFFTSVVRHSPVVEHASEIVFTTWFLCSPFPTRSEPIYLSALRPANVTHV